MASGYRIERDCPEMTVDSDIRVKFENSRKSARSWQSVHLNTLEYLNMNNAGKIFLKWSIGVFLAVCVGIGIIVSCRSAKKITTAISKKDTSPEKSGYCRC